MSLLLLLQTPAAATTDTVLLSPRNRTLEVLERVRTTAPKAAAAILILLAPTVDPTGALSETLEGATLASAASVETIATTDTVLLSPRNLTASAAEQLPKRRPYLSLLFTAPSGATLSDTLEGPALSAAATAHPAGQLDAALAGVTAAFSGSIGEVTTDPVLLTPRNRSVTTYDQLPKRRSSASILFPAPSGGSISATLAGLTLAADAATTPGPGAVDDSIFRARTRNLVASEATQLPRRRSKLALLSPSKSGDVAAALGGLTLAADASLVDPQSDLYLGGETRLQAYPAPKWQWHKRRHPYLTTAFNYPVANLAIGTQIGELTLTSLSVAVAGPSGALTATLSGLTVSSQSASPAIAIFSATLDGFEVSSIGTEIALVLTRVEASLEALTVTSSGVSQPAGAMALTLDGVRVETYTEQIFVGNAETEIGGLSLRSLASTVGTGNDPDSVTVTGRQQRLTIESRANHFDAGGRPVTMTVRRNYGA